MSWRTAVLCVVLGGCSQAVEGIGNLTTGSLPGFAKSSPIATGSLPAGSSSSSAPSSARIAGAERISGNLYRVMATDRSLPDRIERENYTLLKAAEATKAVGGTHFVLVNASNQAPAGPPSITSLIKSNGEEYGAYFRVLEIEQGGAAPIGAMAADEIIHFFGPKFGRASDDGTGAAADGKVGASAGAWTPPVPAPAAAAAKTAQAVPPK